jgi:hypothetical protein
MPAVGERPAQGYGWERVTGVAKSRNQDAQ